MNNWNDNNWNDEVRAILEGVRFADDFDYSDDESKFLDQALDQIRKATSELVIGEDIKPHDMFYKGVKAKDGLTQKEREENAFRANQRESIK